MGINDVDEGLMETIINDILDECGERVREIILFGSYARNMATEKSDIDIAVVLKGQLKEVEDFEVYPTIDAEVLFRKYKKWIHICPVSEIDYERRNIKELRDISEYGIVLYRDCSRLEK